jgi:hypothetical protein
MIHLIFAAAVSTAGVKPLFVPPKGMTSVAADRTLPVELSRRTDATFLRQYRGFGKIKPSWSNFAYKVPEEIYIVRWPTAVNAAEWGARSLSAVTQAIHPPAAAQAFCREHHRVLDIPRIHTLASHPLALCNGQRGWLNAYTRRDETYEEVFARSRDQMYVALLRYQTALGDTFSAAHALRTLCPPNVGEVAIPTSAVPFTPPARWARSANTRSQIPEFAYLGGWYNVSPQSHGIQDLQLFSTSDTSEYTTPEQLADMWRQTMKQGYPGVRVLSDGAVKLCAGADAWLTRYEVTDRVGRTYAVDNMYAYGNDTLYVLQYGGADSKEDPAANKALKSLCPPQSSNAAGQ